MGRFVNVLKAGALAVCASAVISSCDAPRAVDAGQPEASDAVNASEKYPEVYPLQVIRDGLREQFPALLTERSGPPVELWVLAHRRDRFQMVQRLGGWTIPVGIADLPPAFAGLDETTVQVLQVLQGPQLGGLVRGNVRVVFVWAPEVLRVRHTPVSIY